MTPLSENKHMPPPWMKYPSIPLGSIGWRMGFGEAYLDVYHQWISSLTSAQKDEHKRLFPEPTCWHLIESKLLRHGAFWVYPWNEFEPPRLSDQINEKDFLFFWGHHQKRQHIDKSCLSQWFPREFRVGAILYTSMEQYMMSQKARLFGDTATEEKIMAATDQGTIKALGRVVAPFDRAIWDRFKSAIVMMGNYYKFAQHADLRSFLIQTGSKILVEASPHDKIWGIGLSEADKRALRPSLWQGQNRLGLALMTVRAELQRVWANEERIDQQYLDK